MIAFRRIFDPKLGKLTSLKGELKSQDLETLAETFTNLLGDYNKLSEAISQSMERYWKAMELNEVEYEIIQGNALIKYSNLFVRTMQSMKDVIPPLKQKIILFFVNQSEEIMNILDNLPQEEFTLEFENMLKGKGLSGLEINNIVSNLHNSNLEKIIEDVDLYFEQLLDSLRTDIENYASLAELINLENRKGLTKSIPEPLPSIVGVEKSSAQFCTECGTSLTWIDEYKRWYCYKCEEYR